MHFTYAANPDFKSVTQGDILRRTPAIDDLLREVHPHFFQNGKNLFFMVLTQSCDLVRRNNGDCKSPYITISPVRLIDDVLNRQIQALKSSDLNTELPILTDKAKSKLSEFLQRLYNNNEPGYFFLEAEGTDLPGDCCAYLNLSIAIKAREHYDKCLEAKSLELDASFQAKLGWLVGQIFARVGTADWPQASLKTKVSTALKDVAIWVPDAKLKTLIEQALPTLEQHPDAPLSISEVATILRGIPDRKKQVMERAAEIIGEVLSPQNEEHQRLAETVKKRLENDLALTSLLK